MKDWPLSLGLHTHGPALTLTHTRTPTHTYYIHTYLSIFKGLAVFTATIPATNTRYIVSAVYILLCIPLM